MPDTPDPSFDPDSATIPLSGPRPTLSGSNVDLPLPEELAKLLPAGAYEVTDFLGAGGMGAVYKARQTTLDRSVAIKVLPGDLIDDLEANFAERFKNEARTMAKMNHPSIVNVFDFGETQTGLLYFVMEFVNGTDVAQMITTQGKLPEDYALSITAHVCDALGYAHERGIIHRDMKPENCFRIRRGANADFIKVLDFGAAKALSLSRKVTRNDFGSTDRKSVV